MELNGRTIWQVAAGDTDRNYVDILLDWDVVAVGPGDEGPWPDCTNAMQAYTSGRKLADLRRFNESLKVGDLVVLRLGTTDIYGVGIIEGPALWLDDFGDVDGWDLQFVRRVKWIWKYSDAPQRFPTYTMKLGDTVQTLNSPTVSEWLSTLEISQDALGREIRALPESCVDRKQIAPLDSIKVANYLFDNGVAANSIDKLIQEIQELIRIAKWYQRIGLKPSEPETLAYLVIPLLRALGWSPQKMAVEWNNIDVALFDRLPRKNDNLVAVVEAKRSGLSVLSARSQAEGYALQDGRERCKRLLVTDGLRYAVYTKCGLSPFPSRPQAYFSLTWFRDSYPIMECKGAREALTMMAADWSETEVTSNATEIATP